VLRTLRIGDRWAYRATGAITPETGAPQEMGGTIEVSIVADTLSGVAGAMMLTFAQAFEIRQADGTRAPMPAPAWMFSFVQDAATRDVAIVADNMGPGGALRVAAAPQIFYPGRWSPDTAYANRLEFADGDFVSNTLAVTGQEWVETPLGPYLSWKAGITSESPAIGRIEGIDWWTPELGAPASFETDSAMPDGARMRFRATLIRTNVVP
jgi:hypothetical protein